MSKITECQAPGLGGAIVTVDTSTNDKLYEAYEFDGVKLCVKFTFDADKKVTKIDAEITQGVVESKIRKIMGIYFCEKNGSRQLVISTQLFDYTPGDIAPPYSKECTADYTLNPQVKVVSVLYLNNGADGEVYDETVNSCWVVTDDQPTVRKGNIFSHIS